MQGRRRLTGRMVGSAALILLLLATSMAAGPSAVSAASSGSVAGSVISASGGAPLGGICATLYTRTGVRTGDSPACTNAQGVYRLTVANAGSYDVQFSDPSQIYLGQWYNNQPTWTTASAVRVRSGRTTSGVNAVLVRAIGSAPAVTGVSPAIGPTSGGTSVTISGSNLSGATAVRFGATLGIITSRAATQVVATSPAGSGVVDITVTSAAGTSATGASDRFTYQAGTTPSITAVGTLRTHTNQPSQASESISVAPAAVGDVLAMAIETKFPSGVQSFTAATVSGGGVTTWIKARSSLTIDGIHDQELWWGVVTSPGSSTITVTYTAGSTSGNAESATALDVQEFSSSSGVSTVWSIDSTGVVDTGVATTAPNYPTLTPTSAGEAYFGYLAVPGAVSAGSTPGVVYQVDARGNQCAYDQSVSSTITPVASGSSQTFFSIGMLLRAT